MDLSEHPSIKAVNALAPAIDKFKRGPMPIVVTNEKLSEFLRATADSEIDSITRLMALASALQREQFEMGWRGFEQICDFAESQEQINDGFHRGLLSLRVTNALEFWLTSANTADFAQKVMIAEKTEKLLDAELLVRSEDSWSAHMLGLLHLKHPNRTLDEKRYVETALSWFRKSLKTSTRSRERINLQIGHCLFALEDWSGALETYRTLEPSVITRLEGVGSSESVSSRIEECEKKLAN